MCKLKDEQIHELVKGIVLIKYSCNEVAMRCLAADSFFGLQVYRTNSYCDLSEPGHGKITLFIEATPF